MAPGSPATELTRTGATEFGNQNPNPQWSPNRPSVRARHGPRPWPTSPIYTTGGARGDPGRTQPLQWRGAQRWVGGGRLATLLCIQCHRTPSEYRAGRALVLCRAPSVVCPGALPPPQGAASRGVLRSCGAGVPRRPPRSAGLAGAACPPKGLGCVPPPPRAHPGALGISNERLKSMVCPRWTGRRYSEHSVLGSVLQGTHLGDPVSEGPSQPEGLSLVLISYLVSN